MFHYYIYALHPTQPRTLFGLMQPLGLVVAQLAFIYMGTA